MVSIKKGFCKACDYPLCDFCYFYDFNPNKDGAYIGLGYCRLRKEAKRPEEHCSKFICFMKKKKERIRRHD